MLATDTVLFSAGKNTPLAPLIPARGSTGEAHAFIIKVRWDALQHLEVLKWAFLRDYAGIARLVN